MKCKKKDIEEDLMKLNEYIEELEEKKKELEQENLQKRLKNCIILILKKGVQHEIQRLI